MFFLLPIYASGPAAETLLVLQAVLLGLAGICVYRFAARRLSPWTALVLTAAYYLYPPLHGAQFFDIHFQPVAAAFLLAAIDCFDAAAHAPVHRAASFWPSCAGRTSRSARRCLACS